MALPLEYGRMSDGEATARAAAAKSALGGRVVILAHHYQRDSIVSLADFVGDSLELSQKAANVPEADAILFCGVDFMAETAAMLASPQQLVLMPASAARCPMAAMATRGQAAVAWQVLTRLWGGAVTPITYQNSYAGVKALCGEHGGAVCTSSNAQAVVRWGLEQKGHVLFMPDENLGRNTAHGLGIPESEVALWDPDRTDIIPPSSARMVVWKGYCLVHTRFTLADVQSFRQRYPVARIVVHPECLPTVAAVADAVGSTSYIVRYVAGLEPGSVVAVGTEYHLVNRLTQKHRDRTVLPLRESKCASMYRVTPQHVAYALEELQHGRAVGRVQMDPETSRWANLALARMLALR